jgi:hypothetical protein
VVAPSLEHLNVGRREGDGGGHCGCVQLLNSVRNPNFGEDDEVMETHVPERPEKKRMK